MLILASAYCFPGYIPLWLHFWWAAETAEHQGISGADLLVLKSMAQRKMLLIGRMECTPCPARQQNCHRRMLTDTGCVSGVRVSIELENCLTLLSCGNAPLNFLAEGWIMAGNAETVRSLLLSQPEDRLIEGARLFRESGLAVPRSGFYKTLGRMTRSGELVRLKRGIYYRPRVSRFGRIPISEDEIVSYYTAGNKGLLTGYRMYAGLCLTTQISKNAEVLSGLLRERRKRIGNVSVYRLDLTLTPDVKNAIEAFEVLQNFSTIEDLNWGEFAGYFAGFAEGYDDAAADYVLLHRKYRKSTIAFMKGCLDFLGVPNGLGKYLSNRSEYKIPDVREIFADSWT